MERENEAATYRDQLLTAPQEHIEALVISERKSEVEELKARCASEERKRFFHEPRATADFSHYCKLANWTLDEAVALSLGKHPKVVNWKSVSPFTEISTFAKEYEKRRDIANRAQSAQQLFDPVMPSIFLPWAKRKFDPLPAELLDAALDDGITLTGWKDLYEDLAKKSKECLANQAEQNQKHVEEISSMYKSHVADALERLTSAQLELEALKLASQEAINFSEKPLLTRERENLQLMALFGAIRGYGYNPESNRNTATAAISHDFSVLNQSFSDDRVRDHLNAAKEFLPGDWRQRWKPKPYSGKK